MGQCQAVYISDRGRTRTVIFCTKEDGHEGEHKGTRKRWPNEGEPQEGTVSATDSRGPQP